MKGKRLATLLFRLLDYFSKEKYEIVLGSKFDLVCQTELYLESAQIARRSR